MQKKVFGPTWGAKICLLIATLLQLVLMDPLMTWGFLFPHHCIPGIKIISYFDLMILLNIAPLILFFIFLVKEYDRQKDECMFQFIKADVCPPFSILILVVLFVFVCFSHCLLFDHA